MGSLDSEEGFARVIGIINAISDEQTGHDRLREKGCDKTMHTLWHLHAAERPADGVSAGTLARRLGHTDPGIHGA